MAHTARARIRLILLLAAVVAAIAAITMAVRAYALPLVQVTHVTRGPVVQAFYATGTISPQREYPVRAQVAGVLMLEPGIDKQSSVKSGQLLGKVLSDDLEKKLRQTQADLTEKRVRADENHSPVLQEYDRRIEALTEILASARREYQRLLKLAESDNARVVEIDRAYERTKTTWSELEAAKAQRAAKLLELRRDLEVATAAYDIAKWNIDQQELRSPIDGVILDWPVPSRTRVAVNDQILMLADVAPPHLVMRAQVDEEDRNKLYPGQLVEMTLYSFPEVNPGFEGRVKTIYAKADPQRRTFEVDVEIVRRPLTSATSQTTTRATDDPYSRFAPGMTGELAFIEEKRGDCTLLPRQALQADSFYVVRNGRVARVAAQSGLQNVTRVEVTGGLAGDDLVIITPIGKLAEGQAVRTQFLDPRAAADLNKPKDLSTFKGFR